MAEHHRNDAAGEHRPPGDPTPQRIHTIRPGHDDPGPSDSQFRDGKRGLCANYASHSLADKQAPHPMARANQHRRSGDAESGARQGRASGNVGCLLPVPENHKPQALASSAALRTAEASRAFAWSVIALGAPYSRSKVPRARLARTGRRDQITVTPDRTQPSLDASLGNPHKKRDHPAQLRFALENYGAPE